MVWERVKTLTQNCLEKVHKLLLSMELTLWSSCLCFSMEVETPPRKHNVPLQILLIVYCAAVTIVSNVYHLTHYQTI